MRHSPRISGSLTKTDQWAAACRRELASFVLDFFFLLGRFFNRHILKFVGIENIPTFQAFNVLGVFMSGDNANPRVFAGGNHRFWAAWI